MRRSIETGVLFLAFFLFVGSVGFCSMSEQPEMILTGEHPSEHPGKSEEHPSQQPEKVREIKINDLAKAIKKYVDEETRLKGGYFMVYDNEKNKPLLLKLKKIHKDRLAKVSRDTYFACSDFEDPEGKIYDIDIFMKGRHRNDMRVMEISIHKEAGKPRYTWYEENGIWRKQAVK